jgi:hypothetical protein
MAEYVTVLLGMSSFEGPRGWDIADRVANGNPRGTVL